MQFMNFSLEKLFKNLADSNFKQLTEKSSSKYVELSRQKDAYLYQYMNRFKRFSEEKLPEKNVFTAL